MTIRNCLLIAMLIAAPVVADELPSVEFKIEPDGNGFIDQMSFDGRELLSGKAEGPKSEVELVPAGDGSLDSLFRHPIATTLAARIESVKDENGITQVVGGFTDGKTAIPFRRSIRRINATTIEIEDETNFSKVTPGLLVASHRLVLPLQMNADLHQRMLAFAGEHRVEMFRSDMNEVTRREMNISDNRGFMPFWEVGGVVQLPTGYTVWKANHPDTMAYPIEQGSNAPGWADYSEDEWGMSVNVLEPKAAAPWAMTIDTNAGAFSIFGIPPSQMPRAGAEIGVRKITFQIVLHQTSWPAFYPCELDPQTYSKLLIYLAGKGEPQVHGALATKDFRVGRVRERVQPSIVLRSMYRGDDWRMSSIMKDIGQTAPRGGPMDEREARAKSFLDYVKKNGVPTPAASK